jgi:hypothetical protein
LLNITVSYVDTGDVILLLNYVGYPGYTLGGLFLTSSSYSAGVATPDPGEAPPLAGFNMKSPVAYNHNTPYLHDIDPLYFPKAQI